jgi:butyrate kinase
MCSQFPKILVINPGSTTTKIAVFEGNVPVFVEKITHKLSNLPKDEFVNTQVDFRKLLIQKTLKNQNVSLQDIDLIMCRGGLLKPVASGVYEVNEQMLHDLKNARKQHASNLAAIIGYRLSEGKIPVYIADPVVVDEMHKIARYAGHRDFERISIFHALNHKAVARRYAQSIDKKYEDLNLIVAHLGGGISVGAHKKGKVIDVNQALDGEGPFSPERSGTLPVGQLIKKAFSGNYTQAEMHKMIVGKGGVSSYLGTNNMQEIEANLTAEKREILMAMAYQIAKIIGEMATVLKGEVNAVILTGGVAHSKLITDEIVSAVSFIAPVIIYAGEDEMQALANNGLLLWQKELEVKKY